MNKEVEAACKILKENGCTCVLYSPQATYRSAQRGVRPLLEFLESGKDFSEFVAADKVVGAGAAHLYVLLGVKMLWTDVLGERAAQILQNHNISVWYDRKVPYIINRKGDGMCPIEAAVSHIQDSQQALGVIRRTLSMLLQQA